MIDILIKEIEALGVKITVVPISCINDLERDVEALGNLGYHTGYIDWLTGTVGGYIPDGLDFEPRSMIVAAVPSPARKIVFTYRGKKHAAGLPPTYFDFSTKDKEILSAVNALLEPHGHKAAFARYLPLKLLAVKCGLGKYGRNNICYVDGYGSHVNLFAFYSDIECGPYESLPASFMAGCKNCRICADACPTGAIDVSRDIINADICLTSLNEQPGVFPEWLDKNAHHCIVGCMKCQEACPQNSAQGESLMTAEFDERETSAILEHKEKEDYPEDIAARIKSVGLFHYRDVLPRNLKALL